MSDKKKDLITDQPDIDDPIALLDLLKDAILRKPTVDKLGASSAVRQVLHNYEAQNRVFLIAAANAELPRIVRLLSFIDNCEEELFSGDRYLQASTKDLTRMYAIAQSNLLSCLDTVKKVADMRLELMKATQSGGDGMGGIFDSESEHLSALSEITLDSQSRDRVRKVVTGLIEAIERDDKITQVDDDSDTDD